METRGNRTGHSSDWTAVLGKLGGGAPGSQENQQLSEMFANVNFPAGKDEVLRALPPDAEFRVRVAAVDLREAVSDSHASVFRSLYEIIECVKDALRRAEKREARTA